MTMLRHHKLRSQLEAFVDGELVRDEAELVRAHLRLCWGCSGEVQTLRLLKAALVRPSHAVASLPVARLRRFAKLLTLH